MGTRKKTKNNPPSIHDRVLYEGMDAVIHFLECTEDNCINNEMCKLRDELETGLGKVAMSLLKDVPVDEHGERRIVVQSGVRVSGTCDGELEISVTRHGVCSINNTAGYYKSYDIVVGDIVEDNEFKRELHEKAGELAAEWLKENVNSICTLINDHVAEFSPRDYTAFTDFLYACSGTDVGVRSCYNLELLKKNIRKHLDDLDNYDAHYARLDELIEKLNQLCVSYIPTLVEYAKDIESRALAHAKTCCHYYPDKYSSCESYMRDNSDRLPHFGCNWDSIVINGVSFNSALFNLYDMYPELLSYKEHSYYTDVDTYLNKYADATYKLIAKYLNTMLVFMQHSFDCNNQTSAWRNKNWKRDIATDNRFDKDTFRKVMSTYEMLYVPVPKKADIDELFKSAASDKFDKREDISLFSRTMYTEHIHPAETEFINATELYGNQTTKDSWQDVQTTPPELYEAHPEYMITHIFYSDVGRNEKHRHDYVHGCESALFVPIDPKDPNRVYSLHYQLGAMFSKIADQTTKIYWQSCGTRHITEDEIASIISDFFKQSPDKYGLWQPDSEPVKTMKATVRLNLTHFLDIIEKLQARLLSSDDERWLEWLMTRKVITKTMYNKRIKELEQSETEGETADG